MRLIPTLVALTISIFVLSGCECGYGGEGCSAPAVEGLCDESLVVGQRYYVIFGYYSDTGISEATLRSAESLSPTVTVAPIPGAPDVPNGGLYRPFDLNNGTGDGGIEVHAVSAGFATVNVTLRGWDDPYAIELHIVDEVDAPEGFQQMEPAERLTTCLDSHYQ